MAQRPAPPPVNPTDRPDPDAYLEKEYLGIEKDGLVWNGLRWKRKDEGPDEDESYDKPYFLEEPGNIVPYSPLENEPGWPYVIEPEIDEMTTDEEFREDDAPLVYEDMKIDSAKPDITYMPPWIRKFIPPPSKCSLREGDKLINKPCYIDDDPRNLWLYKEHHGPEINTIIRPEWGAEGFKPKRPLNCPVKHVRITYTGGQTHDYPEAFGIMQDMQKEHRALGLEDVALNYYIGRDGAIYEGRGWYVDADRPKEFSYLKGDCLDIAYLGDFSKKDPAWFLLKSTMDIIKYAVEIRAVDPNFKLIPFRTLNLK